MRKLMLAAGIILLSLSFAQAEETITVTSYYPSPYGVYNELRLYPRATEPSACDANNRGAMYYNSTTNSFLVCGSSGWQAPSGASASTVFKRAATDYCGGTAFICQYNNLLYSIGGGAPAYPIWLAGWGCWGLMSTGCCSWVLCTQ